LHALSLFVAQLRSETDQAERARLVTRIDAAVTNMNQLFNALLDISKLDAGALEANLSDFPVDSVLKRIEATFASAARERGLRLRVVASGAWIRSDAILLERILLNLASNAIRYTSAGRVLIGCRRVGDRLRIDVCDTGIGIPEDQHRDVFGEFYQVAAANRRDGMGLGLAIVERLCALLEHPISLASRLGKGSQFSVSVPMVPAGEVSVQRSAAVPTIFDPLAGKLIVVLDDDELTLDSTGGLIKSWGCRLVTAGTDREALASLGDEVPHLVISDFWLKEGLTGIAAVAGLRHSLRAPVPAFLISGDISPERLEETRASGLDLLHKPVSPLALRAMMSRLLKDGVRA
jgi:CheY-like chemotaxis protein/anti-sigma regulatory factor (Ser/Thr protein kinase)